MGESSACLMRSLSQPSPTSIEANQAAKTISLQRDSLRALTTSISFGRFISEPLDWEKWSAFTQNRCMEEVEKYSKPGSVAQKKAYFEAHYKRIAANKAAAAAAAALEQENAATDHSHEPNSAEKIHNNSSMNSELAKSDELIFSDDANICKLNVEGNKLEATPVEGEESIIEQLHAVDNHTRVEFSSTLETVESHGQREKTPIKGADQKDLASSSKKKPSFSSLKSSSHSGASKLRASVKLTPVQHRKEENVTPIRKMTSRDSLDKKKSTHMSINFASRGGEISKASSPIVRKILNVEGTKLEATPVEGAESIIEQLGAVDNPTQVELSSNLETVESHGQTRPTQQKKTLIKGANQKDLGSSNKKKPAISSLKPSTHSGVSNLRASVKLTPVQHRKEENATPIRKKTLRDSLDKKKSTIKSLHMSINFSSRAGEISKATSPIIQKIGNSRIVRTFTKTSKNSSTESTATRASVNGVPKHPSVGHQPGNRRYRTPLDHSVSGSRTVDGKSQSLSKDHSDSSSVCGRKPQSPVVSSSFTFRSEERAAKRREFFQNLEEKLKAKEAEKLQLQLKSKEKARNDFEKMRQSVGLKAKTIASFPREMESQSNHIKKIPPTRSYSPKLSRKPCPSIIQDTSARSLSRSSLKNDGSKQGIRTNDRMLVHSINSPLKKNVSENASPNIQLQV